MEIAILAAAVILYQIFWCVFIKDFTVKKYWYFISVLLTFLVCVAYYYFSGVFGLKVLPYALNLLILINMSIVDCEYFEVDGKSYWFLFLPTLAIPILNHYIFAEYLFSFLLMFAVFWIIDKIIGVEKIGGADVKILLILALSVSFYDCISLLGVSFIVDVLFFIIKAPIDKLRKKTEKTKIPMIVSITITWILICFMNIVI